MADDFWFKAHFSWGESFPQLDDKSLASLARAIWKYAVNKEDSELVGNEALLWPVIRGDINLDMVNKANGKLGGRPRKDPIENGRVDNKVEYSRVEGLKTPIKPLLSPLRKGDELEESFKEFYDLYPRHEGRQAALKAWKRLSPSEELQEIILSAVQAQASSPQWKKDNGQFIPLPASWLNGKRWEDETGTASVSHVMNSGVTL